MHTEVNIQKNNYFEYRQVESSFYEKEKLPKWMEVELIDKNAIILDYGCGFGQILTALKNENFTNVYGVDIETNAIEFCQSLDLEVKELDLNNLQNPFSFKFDTIILSHVIEHMPKDEIINTLSLIRNKFLEKGGQLLIAVPNAQANTGCYWAYEDWTHTTLFTTGSLYYVLRAAGFNSVEFLDVDCTLKFKSKIIVLTRRLLLGLYILNKNFWNRVTCSSYHKPSIQVFSFELKVKAS